jgi:hypothetical protein
MHAANKAVRVERYLKYLDKEMTIMGILSGFCVTVLALGIKLWSGTDSPRVDCVVRAAPISLALGALMLLLAALAFYRQRSLLAWYFGQLSLQASGYETGKSIVDWLRDADGWDTWMNYQRGFWLLVSTSCELVVAGCGGDFW